jgi:hypothetical protein
MGASSVIRTEPESARIMSGRDSPGKGEAVADDQDLHLFTAAHDLFMHQAHPDRGPQVRLDPFRGSPFGLEETRHPVQAVVLGDEQEVELPRR